MPSYRTCVIHRRSVEPTPTRDAIEPSKLRSTQPRSVLRYVRLKNACRKCAADAVALRDAIRINDGQVRGRWDRLVRTSVEDTLNNLLDAEVDML